MCLSSSWSGNPTRCWLTPHRDPMLPTISPSRYYHLSTVSSVCWEWMSSLGTMSCHGLSELFLHHTTLLKPKRYCVRLHKLYYSISGRSRCWLNGGHSASYNASFSLTVGYDIYNDMIMTMIIIYIYKVPGICCNCRMKQIMLRGDLVDLIHQVLKTMNYHRPSTHMNSKVPMYVCVYFQGVISQYFTTLNCPVCEVQTSQGVCEACKANPQRVVSVLNSRIQHCQKTFYTFAQVSYVA